MFRISRKKPRFSEVSMVFFFGFEVDLFFSDFNWGEVLSCSFLFGICEEISGFLLVFTDSLRKDLVF